MRSRRGFAGFVLSRVGYVTILCCSALIGGTASAEVLVQYDPVGGQTSGVPVAPAFVAAGLTASDLSQSGLEDFWENTGVWPVGRITSSPAIALDQYLAFTLSAGVLLETVSYDKQSYLDSGPSSASIRSSLDGFGSDIATVAVNPSGRDTLMFDLSALQALTEPTEFRIYFYGAPNDLTDWADLFSSQRGGNGLVVYGTLVPEPGTFALLLLGIVGLRRTMRRPGC